jgi:hypothetical protein
VTLTFAKTGPGQFDHRLAERFPVGSSEAVLIRELWLEGFQPETPLDAPEKKATFHRMGGLSDLARRDAAVSWTTDGNGKLTSISGDYEFKFFSGPPFRARLIWPFRRETAVDPTRPVQQGFALP